MLSRFNKGRPLPLEMTRKIESYFEYYWLHDKNYAMKTQEDLRFLSELQKDIRVEVRYNRFVFIYQIYKEFLFKNFLYLFKHYFMIERDDETALKQLGKYYNWKDPVYASFMVELLKKLEPRRYKSGEIIFKD